MVLDVVIGRTFGSRVRPRGRGAKSTTFLNVEAASIDAEKMPKDSQTNGLYRTYRSGNDNRRSTRFAISDEHTQRSGGEPKGTTLAAEKRRLTGLNTTGVAARQDPFVFSVFRRTLSGRCGKIVRFCEVKRTQMTVLWYSQRFATGQQGTFNTSNLDLFIRFIVLYCH